MTLLPGEIARLDQTFAAWAEWLGKLDDDHIRKLMDTSEVLSDGRRTDDPEVRRQVHMVFRMGLFALQVAAQTAKEMK